MKKIDFLNEEQTYKDIIKYSKDEKEILVIFKEIEPYPLLSSYLIKLFRLSKQNKFRLVFIIPEEKINMKYFNELKKFIEFYSSIKEYENLRVYTSFEIKLYEDDLYYRKLIKSLLISNNFSIKERNLSNFFDKKHDCQYNSFYLVDFTKYQNKSITEIEKIKSINRDSIVVLMADSINMDLALDYMRLVDYVILKPFEVEEFIKIVKKLTLEAYFKRENRILLEKITKSESELREINNQINDELKLASDIQKSLQPKNEEIINDYEITYEFRPSFKIGGDFYENIKLTDDKIFIAFADISGHGIPAALLSSMLKMCIQNSISILKENKKEGLKLFLEDLNEKLINVFPKGKFVSMFTAVLNTKKNKFTYCKNSQEPALLINTQNEKLVKLETDGVLLGMFSTKKFPGMFKFEVKEIKLDINDKIIFYTDGITEIQNENGAYYSKYFENDLISLRKKTNKEIIDEILKKAENFISNTNNIILDDVSLLIISNIKGDSYGKENKS